jgi:hypothetical protein
VGVVYADGAAEHHACRIWAAAERVLAGVVGTFDAGELSVGGEPPPRPAPPPPRPCARPSRACPTGCARSPAPSSGSPRAAGRTPRPSYWRSSSSPATCADSLPSRRGPDDGQRRPEPRAVAIAALHALEARYSRARSWVPASLLAAELRLDAAEVGRALARLGAGGRVEGRVDWDRDGVAAQWRLRAADPRGRRRGGDELGWAISL